jgi:hypothetical protein
MTPLTAEKIAELERLLAACQSCMYEDEEAYRVALLRAAPSLLSLAKRVAGAPVGRTPIYAPGHGLTQVTVYLDESISAELFNGKRVALVEIVGGEEGNG